MNASIDPFDNCGTALLQRKLIFFDKVLVSRLFENDVNETINVTSYLTKLCHFALQMSSYLKGSNVTDPTFSHRQLCKE